MAQSGLHNLQYAPGSRKKRKRIGRGQGSGHGGTATKGHKGARSRTGYSIHPAFEGGQMPLVRRAPKFGFHSPFRVEFQIVNVSLVETLAAKGKLVNGAVTPEILYALGAISKKSVPVKILGNGEIKSKVNITAHAYSASAKQKIESAGGSAQLVKPSTT